MKARLSFYLSAVVLLSILAAAVGCSKALTDDQIASDIQNKLTPILVSRASNSLCRPTREA